MAMSAILTWCIHALVNVVFAIISIKSW
jgi:hypothetical protein